jgi:hypothetical protein
MMNIPETHLDLLEDAKKAFLYLATLMPNGAPQVTPVWFSTDGTHILINTAQGRIKDLNMRAHEHIDALASKYLGVHKYPSRQPDEKRIIYKIKPLKVDAHG